MNDKEMIKQMAKCMANCENTCDECFEQMESVTTKKIKNREQHCLAYMFAKRAVEQNYRKLPEGAIVLSMGEYEKLKLNLAIEKKRADESYTQKEVEEIIASKERIKSKETAEKIYRKAEKKARFKDGGYYDKDRYYLDMEDLKEILEQFGVDLKGEE